MCAMKCYNFTMKRLLFVLLSSFSVLLSSCQVQNNLPQIMKNGNLLNQTIDPSADSITPYVTAVDQSSLLQLTQLNHPFLLYVGNPSCGSCQQFKPILLRYLLNTQAQIYYLDTLVNFHQLSSLNDAFPDIFSEPLVTPSLYLIQGQSRMLRRTAVEAFFSYARFKPLMDSLFSVGSSYIIHKPGFFLPSIMPRFIINFDYDSIPAFSTSFWALLSSKQVQFLVFDTSFINDSSFLTSIELLSSYSFSPLSIVDITSSQSFTWEEQTFNMDELMLWIGEIVL
jgi:predicted bacteriocin transport accessory protein